MAEGSISYSIHFEWDESAFTELEENIYMMLPAIAGWIPVCFTTECKFTILDCSVILKLNIVSAVSASSSAECLHCFDRRDKGEHNYLGLQELR